MLMLVLVSMVMLVAKSGGRGADAGCHGDVWHSGYSRPPEGELVTAVEGSLHQAVPTA